MSHLSYRRGSIWLALDVQRRPVKWSDGPMHPAWTPPSLVCPSPSVADGEGRVTAPSPDGEAA